MPFIAQATEIPAPAWRPGFFMPSAQFRLHLPESVLPVICSVRFGP